MGLMMSEGKFVGRDEIALVPTPEATASWKPVPHSDVIDAVTEVVKAHNWQIPTARRARNGAAASASATVTTARWRSD